MGELEIQMIGLGANSLRFQHGRESPQLDRGKFRITKWHGHQGDLRSDSRIFMWSDIGCFRLPKFRHKLLIQHPELVPRHSILQMAHHDPHPPPKPIWNDKFRQRGKYFYHSGSQAIGYADTWREFHKAFLTTVEEFNSRNMFLGEDQMVLQSTCLLHPNLCAYVDYTQVVPDNHYFGLRRVLYTGGNYTYWRPPGARIRTETVSSHTVTLE